MTQGHYPIGETQKNTILKKLANIHLLGVRILFHTWGIVMG